MGQTSCLARDEQEVAGHAEAMETIFENYNAIPITENYIKQLHATLLRRSEKDTWDTWHCGEYKKHANSVEAFATGGTSLSTVFKTIIPLDTPTQMQDLLLWTRETLIDKGCHPPHCHRDF